MALTLANDTGVGLMGSCTRTAHSRPALYVQRTLVESSRALIKLSQLQDTSEDQGSGSTSQPPTQANGHASNSSQPPTQAAGRGPPRPRPVFPPSHLHPSSSQAQAPFISSPSSQSYMSNVSASAPIPPQTFVPPPPPAAGPADPYARYFDPPSSPSPELPEIIPIPTSRDQSEPAGKLDKGKKRAGPSGSPVPPKKANVTAPSASKAKTKATASKGKGKAPAKGDSSHTGRQLGAQNYSEDDVSALLHFTRSVLPLGGRMWDQVHTRYNVWA